MVRAAGTTQGTSMNKTKNTTEKTSAVKAEFMFGADAFKTGFEKTAKLCEGVGEFNKDTLEAYIESATVAGNSLQSVAQETSSYATKAVEDAIAASKAMMGSKSIHEVVEIQTDFVKTAFAAYVSHLSRFSETLISTGKQTCAPLQARAEAAAELITSAAA
jgi:phasin family protein